MKTENEEYGQGSPCNAQAIAKWQQRQGGRFHHCCVFPELSQECQAIMHHYFHVRTCQMFRRMENNLLLKVCGIRRFEMKLDFFFFFNFKFSKGLWKRWEEGLLDWLRSMSRFTCSHVDLYVEAAPQVQMQWLDHTIPKIITSLWYVTSLAWIMRKDKVFFFLLQAVAFVLQGYYYLRKRLN
jgi:hypothetical protein